MPLYDYVNELVNWTSSLKWTVWKNQIRIKLNRIEKESYFPVCLRLWITGDNVVSNVQFFAQMDRFAS